MSNIIHSNKANNVMSIRRRNKKNNRNKQKEETKEETNNQTVRLSESRV
jgi:hypothetical protein